MLTEEEMAARVARKQELLRQQGRRAQGDAKVLFGAEFQMGKRETARNVEGEGKKSAGIAGFLLPGDVGGVNLALPFAAPESSVPASK